MILDACCVRREVSFSGKQWLAFGPGALDEGVKHQGIFQFRTGVNEQIYTAGDIEIGHKGQHTANRIGFGCVLQDHQHIGVAGPRVITARQGTEQEYFGHLRVFVPRSSRAIT